MKTRQGEMKLKIISILLICSILIQLIIPLVSFAASINVTMSSTATQLKTGDTVYVDLYVTGDSIAGLSGYLDYDTTVFGTVKTANFIIPSELQDEGNGDWMASYTSSTKKLVLLESSGNYYTIPNNGLLVQLKLSVIKDADASTIKLNVIEADGESDYYEVTEVGCDLPKAVKKYTISYNANTTDTVTGLPSIGTKNEGSSYTIQAGPTRTNYTFTGWNTKSDGTGTSYLAGSTYSTDANLELYAQWDINKSTLTVNPNGGVWAGSSASQTFTQGYGTTKTINAPTTTPNGNVIKFNGNGGTAAKLQEPQTTTFSGWTGAALSGTTYTFGSNDETLTANYTGNSIQLPSATKTGATFKGWYDAATGGNLIGGAGATYTPAYTTPNAPITLFAQYQEDTYTLTVNPNGGTYNGTTSNSSIQGTYNSNKTISNPTAPNGYTVTLNNDGATSQVVQTKTFKQWNVISGNGNISGTTYTFGTQDGEIKADYESNSVTLTIPTKTGYTFDGWYTQLSGGTKVTSPYMPTSDITLYAHWTPVQSTLTVDPGDGTHDGHTTTQQYTQDYGTTKEINDPVAPNANIITFNSNGGTPVTQITQTTTFSGWTGATLSGKTYTFGINNETLTANYTANSITLPNVTKTGETFLGWSTDTEGNNIIGGAGATYTPAYTTPNASITLYAQYQGNTYTLTINPNGGTYNGKTSNSSVQGTYNSNKTISNPTAPNGYTVTLNNDGATSQVVQTKTFKQWNVISGNGNISGTTYTFGTEDGEIEAQYESNSVTLPEPTKTGYTFDGWYTQATGGTKVTSPYMPTSDITLYAHWTANTYTLTINPNGGTYNGTTSNSSIQGTYNSNKTIANPTAPNGYTVTLNNDGATSQVVQTKTFKQWNVISGDGTISGTTYTFGTQDGEIKADYESNSVTLTTPTKTGYTFDGWYTQATGGTKVTSPYMPTSDITLYAHWTPVQSTLTVNPGDGTYDGFTTAQQYTQNYGTTKEINDPVTPNANIITFDSNGGTPVTQITQTTTFSGWTGATLSGKTYTFGINNEILTANYTANSITLPNVTKTGVTFLGWSTDEEGNNIIGEVGDTYTPVYTTSNASITLYAQYQGNTYTLTINPNGGTYNGTTSNSSVQGTYNSNKTIANPTAPNGYTVALNNEGTTTQLVQTKTFKQWNVISGNGTISGTTYTFGTEDGEIEAEYETNNVTLPEPTKTGYTFDGWYTQLSGGTKVTSPYMPTSDITLYAQWTANTYTITFNPGQDGTVNPTTKTVIYNQQYGILPTPVRPGFDFNGWKDSDENIITETDIVNITNDTTLTALWLGAEYTVTFDPNGGEVNPTSKQVRNEGTYGELPTPTKKGYTFKGWINSKGEEITSSTIVNLIENETLTADWEENVYTITFDPGADATIDEPTKEVKYGDKYGELPIPTKPGYVFDGWYMPDGSKIEETDVIDILTDITVIAGWTGEEYTLTFNYDGGNGDTTSKTIKNGEPYGQLPNATKTGYTFKGWFDVNEQEVTSTTIVNVTSNTELKAKYEINKYTVTFKNDDGTVLTTIPANYGTSIVYTGDTPVKSNIPAGYEATFTGWDNESALQNITNDITLTATYSISPKVYTITYNNLKDSDNSANPTTYTIEDSNITLVDLPNQGKFIFKGWYTSNDETGTKVTSIDTSKLGNIILHAQWENDSLYFKSKKYKVGENDIDNYEDSDIYLNKIEPETTLSELIDNCDTNGEITVIDENGQALSSEDFVGTTMIIKVTRNDEEILMTIVVMGDIDGDGKATAQDLSELNKAYLGISEVELTGARFKAADIDDSEKITATDFSELNRASLGISKLIYKKPNKQ